MKKQTVIITVILALTFFASCTVPMTETEVSTTESATAVVSEETSVITPASESTIASATTESAEPDFNLIRHQKYQEALLDLYNNHRWPQNCTSFEDDFRLIDGQHAVISENGFGISDVDCDEKDELLIYWKTTSTMVLHCNILQYDPESDSWLEEGLINPYDPKFFDNGMIMNPVVHNQGWGQSLWPYIIFEYDGEHDKYKGDVGEVSCWDKTIFEAMQDAEGMPEWPADKDPDNCGVVYFINYPGYSPDAIYSQLDYDMFVAKTFGNEIHVDYKSLSLENIKKITDIAP